MTTRRVLLMAMGILLVTALATGCGLMRQSMKIDYNDKRIEAGLDEILDRGGSAKLSDLTSWPWDEVHLFHEYTDRDFIEKTVGAPVIKSKFYESKASLLVFEEHGKPVKAIGLAGDYLRGAENRTSFPADATVARWGDGFLVLTAPTG